MFEPVSTDIWCRMHRRTTFEHVQSWLDDALSHCTNLVCCLVGNKIDLAAPRQVSRDEGETYAREHGLLYFETSAATGHNVEDVFLKSAAAVNQKPSSGSADRSIGSPGSASPGSPAAPATVVAIGGRSSAQGTKSGCCS
jgi:Ras-related protein Rab-2A